VDAVASDHNSVITVSGPPGSGRTYIIKSVVERLISNHNAIALEIFNTDLSPIPSSSGFNQYVSALEREASRLDTDPPEFAVIFSEGEIEHGDLHQYQAFRGILRFQFTVFLKAIVSIKNPGFDDIRTKNVPVKNHISPAERDSFIDYLVEVTGKHKLLDSLSRDNVESLLRQDSEFLPVMYRAIYPTQESIEAIVDEEYQKIPSENAQQLVQLCALSSSLDVDIPVSVCRRYIKNTIGDEVSYKDIFDFATNEANTLVSIRDDAQNIQHLSIYHPIIAKYMADEFGVNKMDEILEDIARSVRLKVSA